jgi:hypothetical protein
MLLNGSDNFDRVDHILVGYLVELGRRLDLPTANLTAIHSTRIFRLEDEQ